MLECVPKNLDPNRRLDYEANVSDAVIVLPKLQTGIDVNVKFSGSIKDFEYTNESIIFDLIALGADISIIIYVIRIEDNSHGNNGEEASID